MAEYNGYWGIEGVSYEFPMTVEIDEDKAEILSIAMPVDEKDGKTVNLRFVPDECTDFMKEVEE